MFAYPTFSNNNYPLANTKPTAPQAPPATTSTMYVFDSNIISCKENSTYTTMYLDMMMDPLYQVNTRHIQ